jgi:hypothetical protein
MPIEAKTAEPEVFIQEEMEQDQVCRNVNEKEVADRMETSSRMKFGIKKKFGIQLTRTFLYAYIFYVLYADSGTANMAFQYKYGYSESLDPHDVLRAKLLVAEREEFFGK